MLVYILGRALVTTYVQSQTLIAAHGPDIERREDGNISAEMIHGNPFAPKDQVAPNIMMAAVAAFPPATYEVDGFVTSGEGCATAMYPAR